MSLSSLFVGVPQSKYAALAILAAVLVVSFTLLFGKDPIPFTQKMAFVLMLFLISLPGILMTLFQMTCLVTGAGFRNQRWWCGAYAWIVSILLVAYCVMLIAVAVISLTTGEKVLSEVTASEVENFEDVMQEADAEAKQYFVGDAAVQDSKPVVPEKPSVATTEDKKDVPVVAKSSKPVTDEIATFKVAGGASEPADLPEGFDDNEFEPFTSCSAPY